MNRKTDYNTRETQLRVAPAQLAIVHLVENWVPLRRAYICPIVFIEAFAWSAVVLPDFQLKRRRTNPSPSSTFM